MRILITAPNVFTGDPLTVGCSYNVELAAEGTDAQNKTFHALLQCYWASGCHSYEARNYEEFKELIKSYLGAGIEEFCNFANADGTPCPKGRPDYRVKSWRDYSKKERRMTIDNLISEMIQAGVNSEHFEEILRGMEERSIKRQKERESYVNDSSTDTNHSN
jgi:hypothetical protein